MSQFSQNFGKRILRKRLKNSTRNKAAQNFKSASTATIVFDALIPESFAIVKEFTKYLKENGIKTKVFGFVAQKEVPQEMLLWANFEFITKKDLNWYDKPAGPVAESYFATKPDILFVFNFTQHLSLDFLSQLSLAKFKVGFFTEASNDFDLMITPPGGKPDLKYLAEQVKLYINMLNLS